MTAPQQKGHRVVSLGDLDMKNNDIHRLPEPTNIQTSSKKKNGSKEVRGSPTERLQMRHWEFEELLRAQASQMMLGEQPSTYSVEAHLTLQSFSGRPLGNAGGVGDSLHEWTGASIPQVNEADLARFRNEVDELFREGPSLQQSSLLRSATIISSGSPQGFPALDAMRNSREQFEQIEKTRMEGSAPQERPAEAAKLYQMIADKKRMSQQ